MHARLCKKGDESSTTRCVGSRFDTFVIQLEHPTHQVVPRCTHAQSTNTLPALQCGKHTSFESVLAHVKFRMALHAKNSQEQPAGLHQCETRSQHGQ
eukprot:3212177-Amphidinium_carterae.1